MLITLANLDKATTQQVFDQVATHLLKQRKVCRDNKHPNKLDNTCLYKSVEGLSCAAGCLMTDEEYKPSMENKIFVDLFPRCKHNALIAALQNLHDFMSAAFWRDGLKDIAKEFKLKVNFSI